MDTFSQWPLESCPDVDPIFGSPCLQAVSWIVAVGIISCFILAAAMGANDVANSFGTSVGAGVLTLKQACYIASVFEFLGAVTLGAGVTDTIRKGVVEIEEFKDTPYLLMLGNWCTVVGAGAWVIVATKFSLPVSTTQAVVGGIIGFAVVEDGWAGVDHWGVLFLIFSWLISPLAAGLVSVGVYVGAQMRVLRHDVDTALENSRSFISLSFGVVSGLVVDFVFGSFAKEYGLPFWYIWGLLLGIISGAIVYFVCLHYLIDRIFSSTDLVEEDLQDRENPDDIEMKDIPNEEEEKKEEKGEAQEDGGEIVLRFNSDYESPSHFPADPPALPPTDDPEADPPINAEVDPKVEQRFSSAQIVTASFQAFSHGSNDIANVAGPMTSLWQIYESNAVPGARTTTEYWVLAILAVGIVYGLWAYGQKVIETIGKNLTKVTPSRGFSIELGTTVAVMGASFIGAPISSTHAKVGGIVGIGMLLGKEELKTAVNWNLLSQILVSWVVTMPFAAVVSGGLYALFRPVVISSIVPVG